MWLKVTHLATMPGTCKVSRWPRKGLADRPGRWIVFDKEKGRGQSAGEAMGDFNTFNEAADYVDSLRKAPA